MKIALLLALAPAAALFVISAGCSSSSGGASPTTPAEGGTVDDSGSPGNDASPDAAPPGDAGCEASTGPGSDAGPITGATSETWTWVPFSDTQCRDGSTTGIAVNLNPASTKVMLYLEGGGACFNSITCGQNPSKFGQTEFDTWSKRTMHGIMDRSDAVNPMKDWNIVYVPYCTGDVHAGNNPTATVPGLPDAQAFVGYANVGKYLKRIVPTFPTATQVLLTGVSAGGFGAAANYIQVAGAFGAVPVDMLDDSGPLMEDPYLAKCLQDSMKTLWNLDATVVAACGADCVGAANPFLTYLLHIAKANPSRKFGLMDSVADNTITTFFGFGANNCGGFTQVPPDQFQAGLLDIRSTLGITTNYGDFLFAGTDHTTLGSANYDTRTAGANNVKISDWVTAFVGGTVSKVGP